MILRNWITGILIASWLVTGIWYEVNPYVWYIVLFAIIIIWLLITLISWKQQSDARGDSWDGVANLADRMTGGLLGKMKPPQF